MENRVNWRMEYEILAWVLRQERSAAMNQPIQLSRILEPQSSRDEVVRTHLTEIESHDGLFGAHSLPEFIL